MKLVKYQKPDLWDWSPFDQLTDLQTEVNRLFNSAGWGLPRRADLGGLWNPSLDLFEDKDNIVVKVELPGVKKDEIQLSVHDGLLTITGERKSEEEVKEGETIRSERFFGRFQRTVALPKTVAIEKSKANYKDGVLTVSLPKTEEAKPKQIAVNVD